MLQRLFVGFARTYYLAGVFHGAAAQSDHSPARCGVFVLDSVAGHANLDGRAGRVDIHRRSALQASCLRA